jgi:alpha-mannosidase
MTNFFPRLATCVELPPCGYKVFELGHGEETVPEAFVDSATISESGFGVSSLKAQDGTDLLSGSAGLVVLSDTSDTWAHGVKQFRKEMGRPRFVSSTVVEDGPVIRVTRQRAKWMNSDIVLDIVQVAGLDMLELRFAIDWREQEQILKIEIPTALSKPRVFAKVPGAIAERPANGEEEPYQDWAAVEGMIGANKYTVGLINNSTYSYDCLDGLLRSVLIRSAPFARHDPNQVPRNGDNIWQDQGRQERTFWLIGAKGSHTQLALDRRAEEAQTPAEHVMDSGHGGKLPWEQSFLEVAPSSVQVVSFKRAEAAADCAVIRLQERSGIQGQASLRSAALGLDERVELHPWELKTLLVKRSAGAKSETMQVSLLETRL